EARGELGAEVVEDAPADEAGVANGGGNGVHEEAPGGTEDLPVHEALAATGALELLGEAMARGPAEQHEGQLEVGGAGAPGEALPPHHLAVHDLHDGLEGGP